jgi:hypothetical protein
VGDCQEEAAELQKSDKMFYFVKNSNLKEIGVLGFWGAIRN